MPQQDGAANKVVSHDEWLAARTAFLAKEKEFPVWSTRIIESVENFRGSWSVNHTHSTRSPAGKRWRICSMGEVS